MKKLFMCLFFVLATLFSSSAQNQIVAKTVIFLGSKDSTFLQKQDLIKKVDNTTFNKMLAEKSESRMYADTVFFSYKTFTWERTIRVIVHSDISETPVFFSIGGVGTTWESMIESLNQNFPAIKQAVRKKELGETKRVSLI